MLLPLTLVVLSPNHSEGKRKISDDSKQEDFFSIGKKRIGGFSED